MPQRSVEMAFFQSSQVRAEVAQKKYFLLVGSDGDDFLYGGEGHFPLVDLSHCWNTHVKV